ncbi:MAG: Na+/H+ antiporter NhaA, partial [Candidatus Cyclobacteriaceae bacterium M2_1C_046]
MANKSFKERIYNFFRKDSAAGMMLLFATVAALVIANSPLGDAYHHMLEEHIVFGISDLIIDKSVHHWI